MKNIIYNLIKFWIKTSLHFYYGEIKIQGLENVPKNKPVLFLPNHQNALLDPLLIAVVCKRKPYFLTRSDVFRSSVLKKLFNLVRMIPIYRIRDGRDSLKNNEAVFEKCSNLLGDSESLLMFPEANHNLQRRVRPLSKGFTRILFKALERNPSLDIRLVPVGLNYLNAKDFPDKVSIYFGKDIPLQELIREEDSRITTERIKQKVSEALQKLTTHISDKNYEEAIKKIDAVGANYLNPVSANEMLIELENQEVAKNTNSGLTIFAKILKPFFVILNLPVIGLWKLLVKPKVWEPEFTATLRFAFSLVAFPIYYILLFIGFSFWFSTSIAVAIVLIIFVFNFAYVKLS